MSYRDIEELALERGLKVDHSTINRWVIEYAPLLEEAFRKRHKRMTGGSWRMDETYIKVKRQWMYLYRAIELHHMLRKGQHLQAGNQSIFEQFYGLVA